MKDFPEVDQLGPRRLKAWMPGSRTVLGCPTDFMSKVILDVFRVSNIATSLQNML